MLAARRAIAAARRNSPLRAAASHSLPLTSVCPPSAPASAVNWPVWRDFAAPLSPPWARPVGVRVPCRSFSQTTGDANARNPEPSNNGEPDASNVENPTPPKKQKAGKPKPQVSAEDLARQREFLAQLEAAPNDATAALEVFTAIQSADGSGLSTDVASSLSSTLTEQKRLEEALRVLNYAHEQGVRPRGVAFKELSASCYQANEFALVLQIHEASNRSGQKPSRFMYTTALLAASKSKQFERVPEILKQLGEDAILPLGAYKRALAAAIKSKQHQLVLQIYSFLKEKDVELTGEHYDLILQSYSQLGDLKAALGIQDAMRQRGLPMTHNTLYWMVGCACQADDWELLEELLAPTEQNESVQPTASTFKAGIGAYANADRWEKVMAVYELMPEHLRVQLDGWHLGAVIMAHAKAESKELKLRAVSIFDQLKPQGNLFAHTAVLTALLETQQLDEVLALAAEMKQQGMKWGQSTYQIVTLAHIRSGAVDEAEQILEANWKFMRDTTTCYNELIRFYTEERSAPLLLGDVNTEKHETSQKKNAAETQRQASPAARQHREALSRWQVAAPPLCSTLAEQQQRPEEARHTRMSKDAKRGPSAEAIERQRAFLSRLQAAPSDAALALELFAAIQSANGSGLSPEMATLLISTLTEQQQLAEALRVLLYARGKRVRLPSRVFESVSAACYHAQQFDFVLQVLRARRRGRSGDRTSKFLYTTALLAASNAQQLGPVPQLLQQMVEDAIEPLDAFRSALLAANKSNQHELVLEIYSYMLNNDVELTSELYDLLLQSYSRVGDLEAVLEIRDTLHESGLSVTETGLHWIVRCVAKADEWELLQELLVPTEHSERLPLTINAFEAAISAYAYTGRWNKIIDVYALMPEDLKLELAGWHLGAVIMAHANAESEELKLRGLAIFDQLKPQGNVFAYSGALTALLETQQLDAVLDLATEMQKQEMQMGQAACQAWILACIRSGAVDEAQQLLEEKWEHMRDTTACYEELIQFYEEREDPEEAERLQTLMRQRNSRTRSLVRKESR
ncbi:hypothetical protein BBJ28_00018117 [Nothophytophthora sp. Chile5]|nr:hypothetical protein BBJ28_00018117 [Nothophytophthora sp. Chile5]